MIVHYSTIRSGRSAKKFPFKFILLIRGILFRLQ